MSEYGIFKINIKENTKNLEYNTPLRNLIRGIVYDKNNNDDNKDYQIMRVTGGDYSGFYQEELLYKPTAILNFPVEKLPIILYAPLVLDWSGAKLSKTLYIKEGAYNDLPPYLLNYRYLKNYKGTDGILIIHNLTDSWINNPYMLFRNYSIYYFQKEFDKYEKSHLFEYKARIHKKD